LDNDRFVQRPEEKTATEAGTVAVNGETL
jgi:hypothetical protein